MLIEGPSDVDIITDLAAERPWWAMSALDLEPLLSDLPPFPMAAAGHVHDVIGTPWDGISNFEFSHSLLTASDIDRALDELRRGIRQHGHAGIAMPGIESIRLRHSFGRCVIIDIDLDDFILPLRISEVHKIYEPIPTLMKEDWTERMMDRIAGAVERRDRIAANERRMREELLRQAEQAGPGATPLWLRMQPLSYHDRVSLLERQEYEAAMLLLSDTLDWIPVSAEGEVRDEADLDFGVGEDFHHHRRRAGRAAEIARHHAVGLIDPVAMAIVQERDLDPVAVIAETRQTARTLPMANYLKGQVPGTELFYEEGVVRAAFPVGGKGRFYSDELLIDGLFPETIVVGVVGRPLAQVARHPLFVASGVRVASAKGDDVRMRLRHGEPPLIIGVDGSVVDRTDRHRPDGEVPPTEDNEWED